jgi:hypothetical protein
MLGSLISAGTAIGGAVLQSKAAKKAAQQQKEALREAAMYEQQAANKQLTTGLTLSAPGREASISAMAGIMDMLGLDRGMGSAGYGGMAGSKWNITDGEMVTEMLKGVGYGSDALANKPQYNWQASPSYQWRMEQGMGATMAGLGTRGLAGSGAEMKALTSFGQGMATQEYDSIFNRLATVAGFGPSNSGSATVGMGNSAQLSGNAASSIANIGNANAMGTVGQGNAWANAINQIGQLDWGSILGGGAGGNKPPHEFEW